MSVDLSPIGGAGAQFFDNNGVPLSGGKLYTYAAATTTPKATYTSGAGNVAHSNPIILDSAGRVPGGEIWLTSGEAYKFVLETPTSILLGTWDNIYGYTTGSADASMEVQTATAGQTLFVLNTMVYEPGTNTLGVYVDGVNQVVNNAYIETNSTSVTFVSGLHAGAVVKFINVNIASTTANVVTYAPGFTGSVATTVEDKLQQYVSVKDFGAVGDGVADDTVAVQAALDSEQPLDWGGLTYRITGSVSRTYTGDVYWEGRNATILYDGTHVETAVQLQGGGIEIVVNNLTIDGGKLCNKCFEILNNSDSYSNLTFSNVFVTRAKRLNTFNGGDGVAIRGSFDAVAINGGGASDCELPSGQGTSGSVGIVGIGVTWYSTARYVKAMYVNGVRIEKIYSSDLTYPDDQDGLVYFSPTNGALKIESLFSCLNSEFVNCYGRSIKTQCRDTVVQACSFTRTEGLSSGVGNNEIDAQAGNGNFRDLTFSYSNGQDPRSCIQGGGGIGTGKPGLLIDGCSVYLDGVTLTTFVTCFPRDSVFSRHSVTNNKVFGTVKQFFDFYCNGDKNYAEVAKNYVGEIANGSTGQKALVYVLAYGSITPKFANLTAFENVYAGVSTAGIAIDGVSGASMASSLSAWENYGFVNNVAVDSNALGLKTNQVARLGKITGDSGEAAYFDVISKIITSGATATFDLRNASGCLVFIQARYGNTAYAIIGSDGSANAVIAKGTPFEVGNTTEPGSGTFRVWSSGTRQISVKNTDANDRVVSVFVMAP